MKELYELLGELTSGTLTPERSALLQERLAGEPEARRAYREYLNLHVALRSYGAAPRAEAPPRRFAWRQLAAAALVLLAVEANPEVGSLTRVSGARWEGTPSFRPGGMLSLAAGFAELRISKDVRLLLEGPLRLGIVSARRVRLDSGRLVAEVGPAGQGFTIDTPTARVVDLGTEFGIGVRDDDATELQVFRGEVVADCGGGRHHLEAGRAVRIDAAAPPRGIEYHPERFVRMFPTDDDGGQPAGPLYNSSRLGAVRVSPLRHPVTIDGELSDWDARGAFRSACRPPYHQSHTLEGRMMYDERHLYVAAQVGDPAPLRSTADTQVWRGGSVIVRLVTDSAIGWPLEAKGLALADSKNPDIGRRPQDVDERITHMTFWHHRPSGRPRLHLAYGMDFHGDRYDPEGAAGAIRAWPDGLGYTLEYRIPWSLLSAGARPPRKGDLVPATWTVHWSDHEGQVSRGHLVEITNLDEPPYRFLRGRCWGKAIFD